MVFNSVDYLLRMAKLEYDSIFEGFEASHFVNGSSILHSMFIESAVATLVRAAKDAELKTDIGTANKGIRRKRKRTKVLEKQRKVKMFGRREKTTRRREKRTSVQYDCPHERPSPHHSHTINNIAHRSLI